MTRYLRYYRLIWAAAGTAFLAIGLVGVLLPLLPTTPFVILSAFCYARGSDRLHSWLMTHPRFGPSLVDWNRHRAISRKAKRMAMLAMVLALVLAVLAGVPNYAIAMQLAALVPVAVFILTRKSPPPQTFENA